MLNFTLSEQQNDLKDFTAEIANLRLENEPLRRGVYSTFHAETDLLAYELTTKDESLLVVLNRGAVVQLESDYDEVIFGDATLFDNALAISANSVTIVAKSTVENNQTNQSNNTDNGNSSQTNNTTNQTDNSTGDNQTDNNSEETKICQGCCGATSEIPISEPCPMAMCNECDELDGESSNWVRNILAIFVLIAVVVFIGMSRKSGDNH